MTEIPQPQAMPENNRQFIAYLCAPTSETRGRSDFTTTPCGQWQMRASKHPLEGRRWNLQARCPDCGNRPRLTPKNARAFTDKEEARSFVFRKNFESYKEQQQIRFAEWKSNQTEVIE